MPIVLRSLTLLAVVGASFALFVQELAGSWLAGYVTANTLTLANRRLVILTMVVGAAAAVVIGVVAWWQDERRLSRMARLVAPGAVLAFIPPVCLHVTATNPLNLGLGLAVVILLGERLFRVAFAAAAEPPVRAPEARLPGPLRRRLRAIARDLRDVGAALGSPRVNRWLPAAVVVAAAVGYAIYFSVFTLRMHGRFQTYGFDLGQYDNIFWGTLHGYPMRDTPLHFDKNFEQLRGHAELSVFFFLPIYALRPQASTLLVLQSCVLGLGAIPLYRFSARRLPRWYAAALAIAYLFYPPTHGFQFYDFHFQPMSAAFVLFVIDFVDARRYWLCAIAFTIAVGCREDVSVGLAMLGAFLALTGRRVRAGLVMAVVATAYFIALRFFIMPSFGGWGFEAAYKDLQPMGAPSFGGIIATLISNPIFTLQSLLTAEKLRYTLQILLPLAFLPVRRAYLAVSMVPGAIFTLLTTGYAPTIDTGFQYSGHFLPYLFPAAALAIAGYGGQGAGLARRRAALVALLGGTALCGVHWGAIPPRDVVHGGFGLLPMRAPTATERQKDRDIRELHAMIPPKASVAVSEAEMPHISRQWVRTLRDTYDADYILYGTDSGYAGAINAQKALALGQFEKIAERPGLALLRRKATPAAPPAAPPPPRVTPPIYGPAPPPRVTPPIHGPVPPSRVAPPIHGPAPLPRVTPPAAVPPTAKHGR